MNNLDLKERPDQATKPEPKPAAKTSGKEKSSASGIYSGAKSKIATAALNTTPAGKVASFFINKKNKNTSIGITILTTIILIYGIISTAAPAFAVVQLTQIFRIQNFSIPDRSENRLNSRILKRMFSSNNPGRVPDNQRKVRRKVARQLRTGIFDNRLGDLDSRMNRYGLKFQTDTGKAGGRPIGIIDRNGKTVSIDPDTYRTNGNRSFTQYLDEVAPSTKIGKRTRFYDSIRDRLPGGWTRKFFDKIRFRAEGASGTRLRFGRRVSSGEDVGPRQRFNVNEDTDDPNDPNNPPPPDDPDRIARENDLRNDTDRLNGIIDGDSDGKNGFRLTPTGILTGLCTARLVYKGAQTATKFRRYISAIKVFTTFVTLADQIKNGGNTVDSEEVGVVMGFLINHETKSYFDQSDAYRRATGVGGGSGTFAGAQFSSSGNGFKDALDGILGNSGGVFNFLTGGACSFLQSGPVSFILRIVDLANPVLFIISEISEKTGATEKITNFVIRTISGFDADCGTVDVDTGVPEIGPSEITDCIDSGANLAKIEHGRASTGALPVTREQLDELSVKTALNQKAYQQSQSVAYRWFSLENPYSLTSRAAIAMPWSFSQLAADVAMLPQYIVRSFGSLTQTVWAYGYQNDVGFSYYGLATDDTPQVGWRDEDIENWELNEGDWYNKVFPTDTDENGDTIEIEGSSIDLLTYYCWTDRTDWEPHGDDDNMNGMLDKEEIDFYHPLSQTFDNEGLVSGKYHSNIGLDSFCSRSTTTKGVTGRKMTIAYNSRGWPTRDERPQPSDPNKKGYVQCTQLPYFESIESPARCIGKDPENSSPARFDREGTGWLPKQFTQDIAIYLFNRYTVDNIAGLTSGNTGNQANRTFQFINGPKGEGDAPSLTDCYESNYFKFRIDIDPLGVPHKIYQRSAPNGYCYIANEPTGGGSDSWDPTVFEPANFLFREEPYEPLPNSGTAGDTINPIPGGPGGGNLTPGTCGTAAQAAQKVINSPNISVQTAALQKQLDDTAAGSGKLQADILCLLADLGTAHTFQISSLFRPGTGSNHNIGAAADLSGKIGIDGTPIPSYEAYSQTIQKFLDDAAGLMPNANNCEIGVPNQPYVSATKPQTTCKVFVDRGDSPHIHLAIP